MGAVECEVEGRESSKPTFFGRGGSGGGVPSLDIDDTPLVDVLREVLCIMFIVGLAKSCCSTLSFFLGAGEVGALPDADPVAEAAGSAFVGSAMTSECFYLSWVEGGAWLNRAVIDCDMVQ